MQKIIILCFSTAEVFVFPFDENIYEDAQDFFSSEECEELGIKETDCQYMVTNDLRIIIK